MGIIFFSSVIIFVLVGLKQSGITCQLAGYSINVPPSVSVQEGLCVTIPCKFTADHRNTFSNSFGYWRLEPPDSYYIVASNDKSRPGRKPNFYLTGNADSGDCSLTIIDVRKEDNGTYYFRFEERKTSKVKYGFNNDALTTIIVTDLTEEPVISDPGTVIAGINKTLTCTPPGTCAATSLVIQWQKSNVAGVWENSSTVTFTPSLSDHKENITCQMRNSNGKTTEKTIVLHVYSSPSDKEDSNDSPSNNEDSNVCTVRAVDSTIIIGIVIGNIAAFILINVASYFFLKRHMEKRQLGNASPDSKAQDTESTYQELSGQKTDIYYNLKAQ
ncbi:sialic acid-binding Ig-like lectin 14 [Eleutherodactylus coqui]|uniref:sialic acid-binding Ig-like lectin 14 n=1 Tax=Eleutherodactylus coqui TaxID=57060 RepID=UPI0034621470